MNERIRELYLQAGLVGANGHFEYDFFDPEKFAELMVQECVLISRTSTDGFSAGKQMEEHFGVEE